MEAFDPGIFDRLFGTPSSAKSIAEAHPVISMHEINNKPIMPIMPNATNMPIMPNATNMPIIPNGSNMPNMDMQPMAMMGEFPKHTPIAMAYVPLQRWEMPYDEAVALSRGTIFPSLDKPFIGEEAVKNDRKR